MNLNQDSFTRNNNNKPVQFGSVFLPYDDECPHAHQVVVRRTQRKGEAPMTTFNVEHVPHSNSSLTKPLHIVPPSPKRKAEWTA
ncbi:MAG: hypothetical protein K2X66_19065 [Cyanobacteria bacterium]|nr:hypothetical protein [Cyanobacteriota bacterium]